MSVTDLVAHSSTLRQAMVEPRPPGLEPPGDILSGAFDVMRRENAVRPDFALLFDARGNHIWSKILTGPDGAFSPSDMGKMEMVSRVTRGVSLLDMILVHNGRAYQVAGVPILEFGGQNIIGGLILGTSLDRYMRDYMLQSDKRPHMQHRLTLLHEGKVVASVLPASTHGEVEQILTVSPGDREYVQDRGDKYKQWIVELARGDKEAKLEAGNYDVYGPDHPQDTDSAAAKLQGFSGLHAGTIGELYLMRSRSNLKGRGPKIPWTEMFVGIALSFGVAFLLAIWITRPIKDFVHQSRQILTGETDLTQRIDISSRDETQALARNINKAFERLYRLASDVQGAAFHVGASSAEISAASRQMLTGSKIRPRRSRARPRRSRSCRRRSSKSPPTRPRPPTWPKNPTSP